MHGGAESGRLRKDNEMIEKQNADATTLATVAEPARETPLIDTADVVVAGGGIAGCAAALAAARNGASVLLIEKQTLLGGLATAGLITYYLPLCDGEGRQMSYGIAEEFLRLSVRHYPEADIPEGWKKNGRLDPDYAEARRAVRYETRFSPGYMALLLEETLREAGVRILYDTRICGVITAKAQVDLPGGIQTAAELEAYTRKLGAAGTVVRQILIENDSGRGAIEGRAFIDATGSA
ncbi:MAG: FAD-dependent oxidoreductase, partial [Clostridiales bacterium]|nr:FAD-dependent oxidoreductase [Clostridiales bacterium]